MKTIFAFLFQTPLDDLPPDVVDSLPSDIVQKLRDGVIDKIPENVVDKLPAGIQDKIPSGLVDFANSNPAFAAFLAVVGILAIIGFVYGVMKSAFKAALFSAVVGAGAWYFFFQQ